MPTFFSPGKKSPKWSYITPSQSLKSGRILKSNTSFCIGSSDLALQAPLPLAITPANAFRITLDNETTLIFLAFNREDEVSEETDKPFWSYKICDHNLQR